MNLKEQLLNQLSPCINGAKFVRSQRTPEAAWNNCPDPSWLLWYLRKRKLGRKKQFQMLAIQFVELVLPIFEEKYPTDFRPRNAIKAAKRYMKDPRKSTKQLCRETAVAASAAYAASDAYYAASAAYYAAYYAASAADAAANAASSAASAAANADSKQKKTLCDIIRKEFPFKSLPKVIPI